MPPMGANVTSDKLLVTVAPTGAETSKQDCPQLPTTLEELVGAARPPAPR